VEADPFFFNGSQWLRKDEHPQQWQWQQQQQQRQLPRPANPVNPASTASTANTVNPANTANTVNPVSTVNTVTTVTTVNTVNTANTANTANLYARCRPASPHFRIDDNTTLPHGLTDEQTDIWRQVQILDKSVSILTEKAEAYRSAITNRTYRDVQPRSPTNVVKELIDIVKEARGADDKSVIYAKLFIAVEKLITQQTVETWKCTTAHTAECRDKVQGLRNKLKDATKELGAILRATNLS